MIIRSASQLERYLRRVASWVWEEQNDARHHGLKLQEETITEMLLLRLARECEHLGLNVKMFNRIEEGGSTKTGKVGNGADWEWFIETKLCQVGFRVQAKVLSSGLTPVRGALSVGKYEGLHDDRLQTDDLIRDATKLGYNPIYVFYNHSWVSDRALFGSPHHTFTVRPGDWGCAVATARFVKNAAGNKLSTHIPGMLPWHRFFGWDRSCVSQRAMAEMAGEQEFIAETPRPEWLGIMREGEVALNAYLVEHRLQGVAHFDFTDFRG
ncbi:DUF6615 family protein [Sulfitobacter dubius]|uniref:Restriction endonuclease n=1 Tax=Sulfitobacter dubius TaxID=218673 RepID=A0ABY3ZJZ5_9RHOB|nr:DUF6615 family protein [Sulfitobacter dubius]UOA14987.1 hypothetical protein DSM109990_01806 [Sulfitobacter dubius]